ncbi:MAG: peptidase domain-containing ABC transporter [Chitinophagaceae bacterium]|nr:peptidase domain-containing ABC transporter [Chitinophagaceae bacterium]
MKKSIKVKQRDITDCGAACLASVSAHYNLRMPVSRIRQYAGTDKRGTNVLGLIEASERLGFQAKGAKGPIESLAKIPLPAIAHLVLKSQFHHFVVIYKVTKKYVTIMDPGDGGIHKKKIVDFIKEWSGVIVLLLPEETFTPRNEKISHSIRFWRLIKPHAGIMIQALFGAIIYTVLGLSSSIYMQKIVDFVLVDGNIRLLNLLSIGMIIILLLQIFIGTFKSILGLQTGQHIDAKLILGYYKHLLKLPQRFFDTMRVGEIVSRVNDAVKIRVFINDVALNIIVNILIVSFSIGLMFLYYWKLALIMLTIIPVYLILYWINNRVNKKWQRTLMENSAELETELVESLNAAGTIKRFGLEEYANIKTENRFILLLQSIYKSSIKGLYIANTSDFVPRLFTIIILWAGSYFVISRELTPGELLSFYALVGYFTGPAGSLLGANKSIQDALIAADRLFEIIDLETEATNENKIELTPELIENIVFHNVHFRYGTRVTVFEGLNISISKNNITAIVGESGSGKSTLLSLLQNLYPLQEGNISIGGIDLQYISSRSLRQVVSVVPQNIDLFAGTIIENIALGDFEPDMQRILSISQALGINDFIEKMPATYNTILNEQGVNLSGGQRQRVAIARALYRNPEILILDEATSSLDPTSEQKVQSTLDLFKKQGKTIIIIAHRLSTVKNADLILVLKGGKLLEQGNHHELIEKRGNYFDLWNNMQLDIPI